MVRRKKNFNPRKKSKVKKYKKAKNKKNKSFKNKNNSFTEKEINETKELLNEALIQDEINKESTYKKFKEEMINKANKYIDDILTENIDIDNSIQDSEENEDEDESDKFISIEDKNIKKTKVESKMNNESKENINTSIINLNKKSFNISDKIIEKNNIIASKILNKVDLDEDDMDKNITIEKEYKGNKLINSLEFNNKLLEDYKEYIIYDNKIFKLNSKQTKYYKDKGSNLIVYKCKNSRKHERERKAAKLGEFCTAKIKKDVLDDTNNKYIYEFINSHSEECINIKKDILYNEEKPLNDLISFKEKCFEILNNFDEYNRTKMKQTMAEEYNLVKYNFPLKENMLNNILNEWKKYSNKFNKFTIFENQLNYDGEQFLKKYSFQYIETEEITIEN